MNTRTPRALALLLALAAPTLAVLGCASERAVAVAPPRAVTATPPVAQRVPVVTTLHGETRTDDYAWLRNRDSADTIAYLEAENAFAQAATAHTADLQRRLYDEMLGRIKQDDQSPPTREDDYFYYTRTEEGKPYTIYARKKGSLDAPEEILLDGNKMAEGQPYFRVGVFDVSPDHRILAYSVDNTGAERYTLRFRDLATGTDFPDVIENTYYSSAWAADNKSFFYVTVDGASRPEKLWRHTLGQPASSDVVVHHETDERFFLSVDLTRSERYIVLLLGSMATTDIRVLPSDQPAGQFTTVHPRRQGVEAVGFDHRGDRFFIVTNDAGVNFRLVEAPASNPAPENWREVIPHRQDATITGVDAFAGHLVVSERVEGLPVMRVRSFDGRPEHRIEFPEASYAVFPAANPEFNTPLVRFTYTSQVTPSSVFDYDMNTRRRTLLKEQPVLGGFDKRRYASERLYAVAPDGKRVPISIVYRKDMRTPRSPQPMFLRGYGSYGASYDPTFSSVDVSLLDRGVIVGIAHVRGGADLGRTWYEDGRLRNKRNTFTDFTACAEHLVAQGYTAPDRLAIQGASAGGLLMGAVANMRPDLFRVIIAGVPFVDVINTMLDPTIPLTVTEWEQWGNPSKPDDYAYIRSYSPYDNVAAQRYPDILALAGLNDPRVGYWEPAKWVARLRATALPGNLIVLKTNMGAGHGGASGRFERLKELAFEYAFVLDRIGVVAP